MWCGGRCRRHVIVRARGRMRRSPGPRGFACAGCFSRNRRGPYGSWQGPGAPVPAGRRGAGRVATGRRRAARCRRLGEDAGVPGDGSAQGAAETGSGAGAGEGATDLPDTGVGEASGAGQTGQVAGTRRYVPPEPRQSSELGVCAGSGIRPGVRHHRGRCVHPSRGCRARGVAGSSGCRAKGPGRRRGRGVESVRRPERRASGGAGTGDAAVCVDVRARSAPVTYGSSSRAPSSCLPI